MLAEAGGRLVPHEAFRTKLWPDVVVEDRTLTVHMSTLRKALGAAPPGRARRQRPLRMAGSVATSFLSPTPQILEIGTKS